MKEIVIKSEKTIALVAHDNKKKDLIEWVEWNYLLLLRHHLVCTGTTGKLIHTAIMKKLHDLNPELEHEPEITLLKSGPLGGDQQIGAMIADEKIDLLIFFWDPLTAQPHDTDVKALLRIAVLYNLPVGCDRSTADFIISSPLMDTEYVKKESDFSDYIHRFEKK
jgi:methylglyoxal synthase